MTLMERVRAAGNADCEGERPEAAELAALRAQVQELVSVDDLALQARDNPEKARNEVKSACRRAFEDASWSFTSDARRRALVSRLLDSVFGFGVLEDLLGDPTVTEIMVNGPARIFVEREGALELTDRRFSSEGELRSLVDRMLGPLGRRVDEASPMVSARLPAGHRVNVVVPPVALAGIVMTIRKFPERVLTLADLEARGTLDSGLRTFLGWVVRARRSLAVSGGTGAGKTTLLNALSCEIPHDERIITIEDSAELRFLEHPHVVGLEARDRNAEGLGEVTIRDLVTNALRMRPDRIIVGECRGAEALDMLQAMNTGHEGSLTTLHANAPAEAVARLTTMVRYDADLPVDVIEANIASAIDVVVQMQRTGDGRRLVSEVATLAFDRDLRRCQAQTLYRRRPDESSGVWHGGERLLEGFVERGAATAEEVQRWMRRRCAPSVA
jgi:pilus assembly protein CpaF